MTGKSAAFKIVECITITGETKGEAEAWALLLRDAFAVSGINVSWNGGGRQIGVVFDPPISTAALVDAYRLVGLDDHADRLLGHLP